MSCPHYAKRLSASALTATLAAASLPALSQEAEPTVTLDPVRVTARSASLSASNALSATKTDTPLMEIPQSVQIITSTLIEEQQARTLSDVLVNVSGVRATKPEELLFAQPIVRGFPAEIYLNGMPAFGGTAASFDPNSLVSVDRIEVIKGPTSTLYGGGLGAPLGGLINVVSKRPEFEFGGTVGMRVGSDSTSNPYADLNVPLSDRVAARIAAEYQENGSWIDHVEGRRWSVQPSLLFKISPQSELLLRGQYDKRSLREYSGLPAEPALAGALDRNAYPGATIGQPRTTIQNQITGLDFTHRFAGGTKLNVSGQYVDSRVRDYGSFIYPELSPPDPASPTVYPIFKLYIPTQVRESTFDTNVSNTYQALGGRHTLMAGFSYDLTRFYSAMSNAEPIGELDLANPAYGLDYGAVPDITFSQTNRYETTAVYLQDQATYGRFHFLGSLRLNQLNLRQQEQDVRETYHRATTRLGLTYDLTDSVSVYAAYATGFRGAFNFMGLEPPKPETSRNYEAGIKLALRDLGLSGTVALFEQTRRNVTTADPDPANFGMSIQTGEQRARGLEADLVWELTPAFSLLANYAYTQAEVTRDTSIDVGSRLPRVPRHSGRLAGRYRVLDGMAKGLSFGMGVTAVSARELTLPNTVSVPGYALLDAQAAYEFGPYTVALSAFNLTNRKVFDTYQYLSSPVVMPVQPRSAYLSLTARF